MIAIKTADLTQDFKRYADQIIQGETVLISRPRNENLVIITEQEYNELDSVRRLAILNNGRAALKAMQEESLRSDTSEMSIEDIVADVAEYRQGKRGK